jgi:UPF0755 protein
MSDNAQFWKDLLGDDYEQLMDIVNPRESKPDNHSGVRPDKTAPRSNATPRSNTASRGGEKPASSGASGKKQGPPPRESDEDEGGRFYQLNLSSGRKPGAPSPSDGKPDKTPRGGGKPAKPEDDFEVDFDFDGEYGDPDNRQPPPRGEKRSGCLGGILYAALIIAVCLLLASLLWLAATDVLGLGNENERVQVTIPEDFTISSVADILYEKGLIRYKFLFKLYAGFSNAEEKISKGTFELNKNYDYRALVNGMNIRGGKRVEVDVTIPEGYTLRQIFQLFDANNVCSEKELWEAAANYDFDYDFLDKSTLGSKYRLEGYLFPDTYTFYIGNSATGAIDKMLKNFDNKFKDEYKTRAEQLGYSVHEIITIASMIEKEAGADSERGKIASVIYNRLKSANFPYLQIDATIYYAIAETGEEFSTDIDSPYNTYNHKGLPAGPIANPGLASIKAALYPETTTYYFYALNKSGTHNFFNSLAAFNEFISSDQFGG